MGLQERETELDDDEVGEHTEATNDKVGDGDEQDTAPDKGILESLNDLISLVLAILDTSFVFSHSLDHQPLILFTEALCGQGAIGEENANKEGPDTCSQTQDEEQ